MPNPAHSPHLRRFGQFELDLRTAEIYKEGKRIKLQDQPCQVLALLIEHPGELVTREELRKKLWLNDTFVDFDHGVNIAINKLRDALKDSADKPRFIETLPRRGYRWIAPLSNETASPGVATLAHAPVPSAGPLRITPGKVLPFLAIAAAVAAFILALDLGRLRERLWGTASARTIQSLAVLPLHNLSHDPEQEYFTDGMTDELITNLAKLGALRVISRTSVERYKETKRPMAEIARELNVDAVVEGSVLRSGNRIRITAQLIEARSDRHLWAETYERDLREVLALQDEVARDIVGHVQSRIASSARGASTSRHSVGFEAYDAYLKGRYFWNKRTRESLNQAIANFQQAIVIEPDYALAYSGLADTYDVLGSYAAIHPTEAMAKARSAARRALDIDDGLAEAHASLAVVSLDYDWDWPLAEREFRRAIELNPNYAPAHLWYAAYLAALRKPDEAKTEANLAISLDPLSPTVNSHAGWIFYQSRQYDQALLQFRKALELDPAFAPAHMGIGLVSIQWKQYAQAIAELETVRRLSHDSPWALSVLAHAYAASGKRNDARKIADRLRSMSRQEYVPSYRVALIYVALGENDQAFWWLRKAYEERSDSLIYLNTDPELDDIRSDRRFAELVLRVGLPV